MANELLSTRTMTNVAKYRTITEDGAKHKNNANEYAKHKNNAK